MWTVDRTKKPPAVLTNAWQDSGRPSSLFECLGVRVSCVSWNPQIRRICISGTLFLFYALWFFQYAVIVSDYSYFSALCAKIPHFSAGFLSASFLSMQVGPSGGIWTHGLLDPNQARYQASPHPDAKTDLIYYSRQETHLSRGCERFFTPVCRSTIQVGQ